MSTELQEVRTILGSVSVESGDTLDDFINRLIEIKEQALKKHPKMKFEITDATPYEMADIEVIGVETETLDQATEREAKEAKIKELNKKLDILSNTGKETEHSIEHLRQAVKFSSEVKPILAKNINKMVNIQNEYNNAVKELHSLGVLNTFRNNETWLYTEYK